MKKLHLGLDRIGSEYLSAKRKRTDWMKGSYFLCLKGWSSSTPAFSLGRNMIGKKYNGGGLFIRWKGKGIVVDPGINFMENFHNANLYVQDIDYVVVTHNHIDHKCDLDTIIDLDYQFNLKINYYLDEVTYKEYIRLFENPMSKNRVHNVVFFETSDTCVKEICRNKIKMTAFRTTHNCTGSFGIKIELQGEENIILSYTSDTAFFKKLTEYLEGSQIVIANFSETNRKDLFLQESKANHLGLKGCNAILKNLKTKPNVLFLSEFWGGLGDIRVEISKRLKSLQKNGKVMIVPSDIGMVCTLPDLKLCCSSCNQHYPIKDIHILKPMLSSQNNRLQYVCSKCSQVLINDAP